MAGSIVKDPSTENWLRETRCRCRNGSKSCVAVDKRSIRTEMEEGESHGPGSGTDQSSLDGTFKSAEEEKSIPTIMFSPGQGTHEQTDSCKQLDALSKQSCVDARASGLMVKSIDTKCKQNSSAVPGRLKVIPEVGRAAPLLPYIATKEPGAFAKLSVKFHGPNNIHEFGPAALDFLLDVALKIIQDPRMHRRLHDLVEKVNLGPATSPIREERLLQAFVKGQQLAASMEVTDPEEMERLLRNIQPNV